MMSSSASSARGITEGDARATMPNKVAERERYLKRSMTWR